MCRISRISGVEAFLGRGAVKLGPKTGNSLGDGHSCCWGIWKLLVRGGESPGPWEESHAQAPSFSCFTSTDASRIPVSAICLPCPSSPLPFLASVVKTYLCYEAQFGKHLPCETSPDCLHRGGLSPSLCQSSPLILSGFIFLGATSLLCKGL